MSDNTLNPGSFYYWPKESIVFYDAATDRHMMLNLENSGWYLWLFYRHFDGQWVSLRRATEQDIAIIHNALVNHANHLEAMLNHGLVAERIADMTTRGRGL